VAFNPTRSPLITRQVEAIAKELSYDYRIYANDRTEQKILEAADCAFYEGYDDFVVLTETESLAYTESLIQECFDFAKVHALSEVIRVPVIRSKVQESLINAAPLRELGPATGASFKPAAASLAPTGSNALLLVAAINANPPTKGTGELIQEILNLERNAAALQQKYLPSFASWDKRTTYVRIYLRAPGQSNSLDSGVRARMLADSEGWVGLYNQGGVGGAHVNPPLSGEAGGVWIPGNRSANPMTKIKEFTDYLGVGGTIVFAPQAQVANVQSEFKIPKVIPLSSGINDEPREDLIQLALALTNEYSIRSIADKAKAGQAKTLAPVKPTLGDLFVFQLLGISSKTGGNPGDTSYTRTDSLSKGSKGYFEGIWAVIPEGDKAFLKEVGEGSGIGDAISVVNSVRKVGKAALGIHDKDTKINERTKEIETQLGFGIAEVINDPRFKQLKSELDLAN
jgi:hypothetical protein